MMMLFYHFRLDYYDEMMDHSIKWSREYNIYFMKKKLKNEVTKPSFYY